MINHTKTKQNMATDPNNDNILFDRKYRLFITFSNKALHGMYNILHWVPPVLMLVGDDLHSGRPGFGNTPILMLVGGDLLGLGTHLLEQWSIVAPPAHHTCTSRSRLLSVLAPRWWNDLPVDVRTAETLTVFKRRLKTHLFILHLSLPPS